MNEQKKILEELAEELNLKEEQWRSIQVEWAPSYSRKIPIGEVSAQTSSYLDHVMATDLASTALQSKCLFRAALSEMTKGDSNKRRGTLPGVPSSRDSKCLGDKFHTDVVVDNGDEVAELSSMGDFSRFLLHLAGETELADAPDPLRASEGQVPGVTTIKSKLDRLIRYRFYLMQYCNRSNRRI
jgi:hypothetical protein